MKSGRENQCQVILQPLLLQLIPGMLTRGRKERKKRKNPRLLFAELTRPRRWHHRHRVSLTSLPSWLAAPVPLDEPNIPEFYSAALTGQESKLSPTSTLHKK